MMQDQEEQPLGELTDMVSPFVMKMIMDGSVKYRKAYKSYPFGLNRKVMGKWIYVLIAGIIGIVVLFLYFNGYLGAM